MEPLNKFFRIHHTNVGGEIKKRIAITDFPGVVNCIQEEFSIKINVAEMKRRPGASKNVRYSIRRDQVRYFVRVTNL